MYACMSAYIFVCCVLKPICNFSPKMETKIQQLGTKNAFDFGNKINTSCRIKNKIDFYNLNKHNWLNRLIPSEFSAICTAFSYGNTMWIRVIVSLAVGCLANVQQRANSANVWLFETDSGYEAGVELICVSSVCICKPMHHHDRRRCPAPIDHLTIC